MMSQQIYFSVQLILFSFQNWPSRSTAQQLCCVQYSWFTYVSWPWFLVSVSEGVRGWWFSVLPLHSSSSYQELGPNEH